MSKESNCRTRDRISNLPESLLHHILSFLDIKDGACTCVLSKRWNFVWTTVPVLDFPYVSSFDTEKFTDFVEGTLHRHNSSNIDKFSLVCEHELNESRVHSWISTAIMSKVKELKLDFGRKHFLSIPLSLFTCESLTSLELGGIYYYSEFTFPKSISFPRLKRLKLRKFKFTDECWNQDLFSNSPVLENLILEFCMFRVKNFCISIPTLKLLEIINMRHPIDNGLKDCALKIDAPNLVMFTYEAVAAKEFVLSSFPTLVKASACLYYERNDAEISRLLRAVALVKCLTVSDLTLQAICSTYDPLDSLPAFHNVKMLRISDSLTTDEGLIALLKAVPMLESLVFDVYMVDKDSEEEEDDENYSPEDSDEDDENYSDEDDENYSDEDEGDDSGGDEQDDNEDNDANSVEDEDNHDNEDEVDVYDAAVCGGHNDKGEANYDNKDDSWALGVVSSGCSFPHLKSVSFQLFVGNPREMKWVKLILREANALQIVTIRYYCYGFRSANAKGEKEILDEIPGFPRASADCVFKFSSWDPNS